MLRHDPGRLPQGINAPKRIEFWGEGIIFWDYKRLELKVTPWIQGHELPRRLPHELDRGILRAVVQHLLQ